MNFHTPRQYTSNKVGYWLCTLFARGVIKALLGVEQRTQHGASVGSCGVRFILFCMQEIEGVQLTLGDV